MDGSSKYTTATPTQGGFQLDRPLIRRALEGVFLATYFLFRGKSICRLVVSNPCACLLVFLTAGVVAYWAPMCKHSDLAPVCVIRSGTIWELRCPEGTVWRRLAR
jgi:hypothetical protein